jgi:hypothetical protein
VVFENDVLSFLTFDEEHHGLALVHLPQPAPRTSMTVGPTHSAYTFRSRDSLLTEYVALKEVGIQPHVAVQHGPTTSLYYRDPDGITEMQIDNMAPDEATHYLRGSSISTPAASSRVSAPSIRCAHVDTSGIDEAIARLE